MSKKPDEKLYDSRVVHHRLRRGAISRAEYEKYLADLPDDAGEAVDTATRFVTPYAERNYDS